MLIKEYLPPFASELAEGMGLEALQRLVDRRGGVYLNVPTNPVPDDHWLVECLGREGADWLVGDYRGTSIEIPKCHASIVAARQAKALALRNTMSEADAALASGYSARHIRRLRSSAVDDRQQELFD